MGQLHWAPPLGWQEEAYWEGLVKLRAAGRIREVGLSNYGPKGVARAHRFLAKLETPLASNQVCGKHAANGVPVSVRRQGVVDRSWCVTQIDSDRSSFLALDVLPETPVYTVRPVVCLLFVL